ncbi:MAG TPA: type II toxin-antitoxin system HicA family toxin [Pyrinomonadaceae bacterium]|nr:type II toxin-antitoxin system HicA family toxin [Pyrinomonadaceae bacterium]
MKRRELIKTLEEMGCVLVRHGGKHDWYLNPQTKQTQPVPRHNEINENLARSILRKLKSEGK